MKPLAREVSIILFNNMETRLIATMYQCINSTTFELITDKLRYDLFHGINNKPKPKRNRDEDWLYKGDMSIIQY